MCLQTRQSDAEGDPIPTQRAIVAGRPDSSDGRDLHNPLFRPEVLAEAQSQWLGQVLVIPRVSDWIFTAFGVFAAAGIIGLLILGSYAHKERIEGWLVPRGGLVRVFTPQVGVVTTLHIAEGAQVKKGQSLLTVSTELRSASLGASRAQATLRLREQRDSLRAELSNRERMYFEQSLDLKGQIQKIRDERASLDNETALQQQRIGLSQKSADRLENYVVGPSGDIADVFDTMRDRQLVTLTTVEKANQEVVSQKAQLAGLERTGNNLRREEARLTGALNELPYRKQAEISEIDRNIAALEQQIAEAESRREFVLVAAEDGVISALQAVPGSGVDPATPVMNIIPDNSQLEAQLFASSRSVGFIRPGQAVRMRYRSFAYQKFGSYGGTVLSVSRSALSPSELSKEMAGLTGIVAVGEPVYRVTIKLDGQDARAYGEAVPLQPGMQLDADIIVDKRPLYQWILDPIFALGGK